MQTFTKIDGSILIAIQDLIVNDVMTPFVKVITSLGNAGIIWILISLGLIICKRTRKAGVLALMSLILCFSFNNLIIKNIVRRTRPYEMFMGVRRLIPKPHDFSFPSGHSASSFAVSTSLFLNLPKKAGIPLLMLAFAISISRLYLGVHYPADVLFGAFNGVIAACVVNCIAKKYHDKRKDDNLPEIGNGEKSL